MSLMHRYDVVDHAGRTHPAMLFDCLNVQRMPDGRERVLQRRFHQVGGPGAWWQVEKTFLYLDLGRGHAFLVQPPCEHSRRAAHARQLKQVLAALPPWMRRQIAGARTVFGLEELRERLVAVDAGLDERVVRLMKAAIVREHPVLARPAGACIRLEAVDSQGARFLCVRDRAAMAWLATLRVPMGLRVDGRASTAGSARAQGDPRRGTRHGAAAPSRDGWHPAAGAAAVSELHAVVQAIDDRQQPGARSAAFRSMLARLPRGRALPRQAKDDLRRLFEWARELGMKPLQDRLFEIRFGMMLDDDWFRRAGDDDIDALWRLLAGLPAAHVEGNARLEQIDLGAGDSGTYSPASRVIELGASTLAHRERFEDLLRHEVGHAVHEAHPVLIDDWLQRRFGWRSYGPDAAGIDAWIGQMGPASGFAGLDAARKAQVRALLRQALGPGQRWGPSTVPEAPPGNPWRDDPDFGPRLAFEHTGENWHSNSRHWYRSGRKAFALNYWYASLMCVDVGTLDLIHRRMPDDYAAMSPAEFFAELYALYYDVGDRARAKIPRDIAAWLAAHLGAPGAAAGIRQGAGGSGTTRRPAAIGALPPRLVQDRADQSG